MGSRTARAKFTSPFAPLNLSHDEVETVDNLSRVILRNYVAQFEAFERGSGGVVDERVWKHLRTREGVRAYVERRKHSERNAGDLRRLTESYVGSGAVAPPDLPVLLITGSIPGTLDDLMYGLMGSTTDEVRVRTSYIGDLMTDTAVLATLATPTQEDPFLSLTIRWEHHETGQGILRMAVSDRDFVVMERMGLAFTSSGERIGFYLLHSVHFPQTSELPGLVRGNATACAMFRFNSITNQLDVFVRAITDARGSMMHFAVAHATAETYTSISRFTECGYRKKLMWRLRQTRKASGSVSSSTATASDDQRDSAPAQCALCGTTPTFSAKWLLSGGRLRTCALCGKRVCTSCRIKKTLSQVTSSSGKLEQHRFSFCCACYSDVCRSGAMAIAQAEAANDSKQAVESFSNWSDGMSSSVSSE
ncbi:hypothetical protein PybrP1_012223 [[Pythium] brassicae (nom. inval.)]|nr:hypothetical protein PybrP1_012223 [[Pythium] brassicae (nom. inval.)]